MRNITYKMKIKPITPFHIGNGEVHDPMKLIIKGNRAYYLKELEYLRYLMQRNQRELNEKLALSDLKEMQKHYYNCFDPEQTQCYSFQYPVLEATQERFLMQLDNPHAEGQIRAFIRSGLNHQPFIPGSSLKGAIRTALLSHHVEQIPYYNPRNADSVDRRLQAETLNYWIYENERNRSRANIANDPFKAIKISDAAWQNDWMAIYEAQVVNPPAENRRDPRLPANQQRIQQPRGQTLPITMEVGRSGKNMETETEFSIMITNSELPSLRKIFPNGYNDISDIILRINNYFATQLNKEVDIFRRMGQGALGSFESIGRIFSNLNDNECMLRLGMGSGQRFLSYGVAEHSPKTRKMIGNIPLGWMKITFEENNE